MTKTKVRKHTWKANTTHTSHIPSRVLLNRLLSIVMGTPGWSKMIFCSPFENEFSPYTRGAVWRPLECLFIFKQFFACDTVKFNFVWDLFFTSWLGGVKGGLESGIEWMLNSSTNYGLLMRYILRASSGVIKLCRPAFYVDLEGNTSFFIHWARLKKVFRCVDKALPFPQRNEPKRSIQAHRAKLIC